MALVVTATAGVLSAAPAQAQGTWPDKPLKLVVPYPAGGNADNTARLLATQLGQSLGQLALPAMGVRVVNLRHGDGHVSSAVDEALLAAGDTLVLSGHPAALLLAQDKLLRG